MIDTCGEGASLALAEDSTIVASATTPVRAASAALLGTVSALLGEAAWQLRQPDAIGVLNGPGSFTGVRVGLSCAKGLCEALSIPLAAVSRLQALATAAALTNGYAVLNAGRGEVFVLDASTGVESLQAIDAFLQTASSSRIVTAETSLLEKLGHGSAELHELPASAALPLVLARLAAGGDDVATTDANYLRGEQQIYGKITSTTSPAA